MNVGIAREEQQEKNGLARGQNWFDVKTEYELGIEVDACLVVGIKYGT